MAKISPWGTSPIWEYLTILGVKKMRQKNLRSLTQANC